MPFSMFPRRRFDKMRRFALVYYKRYSYYNTSYKLVIDAATKAHQLMKRPDKKKPPKADNYNIAVHRRFKTQPASLMASGCQHSLNFLYKWPSPAVSTMLYRDVDIYYSLTISPPYASSRSNADAKMNWIESQSQMALRVIAYFWVHTLFYFQPQRLEGYASVVELLSLSITFISLLIYIDWSTSIFID